MPSITETYAFLDFLDLKLPALNFTMEFLLHYTSKLIDATINNLLSILQLTICQVTQQTRATTLFPWSCFYLLSLTRKLCITQGDSYRILVLKSSLKAVRKLQHFQDLRAKTEDHKRTMHAISIQKGLCDIGNIGFSNRHLQYNKPTTTNNFSVLKKCWNKLDCLTYIYEMLFIHDLKPSLNVQSDSIQVKLFHKHNYHTHRNAT